MTPPHNQPMLVIDNTRMLVPLPDDWCAEHLQVEEDTPIVFTGAQVIFAGWLGGFIGVVVTVVAAAIWSFVL